MWLQKQSPATMPDHDFFLSGRPHDLGVEPAGVSPEQHHRALHLRVLVFILVRRLTGSLFVAWTTAMLFLVHPIQVETVVWVSSRKGILSGIFMLWALVVRLRPDAEARHDAWYIVLLVCALLSKALAVVLPPIVLLYDLWVRKEKASDAIVKQVIPGLLSLMLLMHTTGAQNSVMGGVRTHMSLSLLQILAVDVMILWQYIFMMLCPINLCVLYDPPTHGIAWQVSLGLVGWGVVGYWIWKKRTEQPLLIWGAATYLLLLFPVLNFFRITTLMNDRYLYLPCIVFFAIVATVVERCLQWVLRENRSVLRGFVLSLCAVVMTVTAAWKTREYMPVWRDSETLWVYAMKHVPSLAVVRIQMALTLDDRGRTTEAMEVLQSALRECSVDELDRRRIERLLTASDSGRDRR